MIFKDFVGASQFLTLADKRQVKVVCSTGEIDRAGEIVDQAGIDVTAFRRNPVCLWNHDANQPIASAVDIGVIGGTLHATCQFPETGISAKADEVYGLIRAGIVNAVSIGFKPLRTAPMDKADPKHGPKRYISCELMELSFTPVPCNSSALITGRSARRVGSTIEHPSGGDGLARRLREVEVLRLAELPVDKYSRDNRLAQVRHLALGKRVM